MALNAPINGKRIIIYNSQSLNKICNNNILNYRLKKNNMQYNMVIIKFIIIIVYNVIFSYILVKVYIRTWGLPNLYKKF